MDIQLAVLDISTVVRVSTPAGGTVEFQPRSGAVEVFCQLKRAGVKLALDADFSRPLLDDLLTCLGWHEGLLLDATVAADEVPRPRPFPDLIWRAMRLAGVAEPQLVAKVGSAPADLLAAKAAGCGLVAGLGTISEPKARLAANPLTHALLSLRDLPELVLNPFKACSSLSVHSSISSADLVSIARAA